MRSLAGALIFVLSLFLTILVQENVVLKIADVPLIIRLASYFAIMAGGLYGVLADKFENPILLLLLPLALSVLNIILAFVDISIIYKLTANIGVVLIALAIAFTPHEQWIEAEEEWS